VVRKHTFLGHLIIIFEGLFHFALFFVPQPLVGFLERQVDLVSESFDAEAVPVTRIDPHQILAVEKMVQVVFLHGVLNL
jgi:hypothetical protein